MNLLGVDDTIDSGSQPRIVVFAGSAALHTVVDLALEGAGIEARHVSTAEQAVAAMLLSRANVILATSDVEWRELLTLLGEDPPCGVLLLASQVETEVWVDGLQSGLFDVLPINIDRSRLLNSLATARRRCVRKELERAEQIRNPLGVRQTAGKGH